MDVCISSGDKSYESFHVDLIGKLNVANARVSPAIISRVRYVLMPGLAAMASNIDALRFTRVAVVDLPVMTELQARELAATQDGLTSPDSLHSSSSSSSRLIFRQTT